MKRKLLATLLACTLFFNFSACGTNPADASKSSSIKSEKTSDDAKNDSAQEAENTDSEDEPPSEETQEAIYNIGESAALKDWEISVTDMQIVESIAADYGSFSPNESGNKYVQVFVTATNNGKQAGRFLPSIGIGDDVKAKVVFGDGYEFSGTNLLGYSNDIHDSTVNPLSTQTGEIAFEVPETVYNSDDELQIHFISGRDNVKFKIR